MKDNSVGNKDLISLEEGHYVDHFSLGDADDNYFGNYQRYDFFQILWLKKVEGNKSYFLDFNEYSLEDNQVLVIFPGQVDRMDIAGKEGYIYAVDTNLFFEINSRLQSSLLNGYYGNVFLPVDKETESVLESLTQMLQKEIREANRFSLLRSYMEAFLFHVASLYEHTDLFRKKDDTRIGELMRLIDLHFINRREVEFYADKLKYTNKKLNQICFAGTGKTVKQHIQERLVLEAKKEIRLAEKSLKEIAFDLGFNEAAYFTRFFKKHTSYTPSEFRNLR